MGNETAQAAESASREVTGLYEQAYRAFGESVKVAMKAQEDTVKFWSEAASKVNPVQTVAGEWVPIAQKNADEYLRLMETSYRRNADLLKKIIHKPDGGDGVEKSTRELWDSTVEVARDNLQDLAITNLHVAQSWTEMLKNGMQPKAAVSGN